MTHKINVLIMKFQRPYFTIFSTLLLAFTLTFVSCSGDPKERTAEDALSAVVNSNKGVTIFGHVSLYNILNKADYKHIPKISVIIDAQLESWKKAFKIDGPMYFAVEAPFKKDGTPETVYAFMDISSADSVIQAIHDLNYATEKAGDITYFQDGDVTCGVRNKLFVLITKPGDYDSKKEIEEAFKHTEGDLSEDAPQDIITTQADVVVGISLERMYTTANTALNKISKAKQDELKELLADGYIQTTVNFNKGEIKLETKNLISDELKDRLWFKDGNGTNLTKKLGKGTPWLGVAANLDMKKLNQFMSDFSPNGTSDLTSAMGPEMGAMMLFSGLDFTKSLTGQFGLVATGDAKTDGGTLEFNAFLGLTKQGKGAKSFIDGLFGSNPKQNGAYVVDNTAIAPKSDGIYIYALSNKSKGSLKLPACAKNFGQNTFSMFVNFKAMNMESLDLPREAKFLELMESVSMDYTRDGGTITLTAKDKSKNILDQMTDYYYKMFKSDLDMLM